MADTLQNPNQTADRWRALAERRHKHLTELHRSGRWRRYYDGEAALLQHIEAAAADAQAWDARAREDASA